MKLGIIGKTNVGKTTFFTAATLVPAKIGAYPFTTIKPNIGIGFVRVQCVCKEHGIKCEPRQGNCFNGTRLVPINLLDVAGLVPKAHEGRGLGTKFLDDLRKTSALIHIVDASGTSDEEGRPTQGYDPKKDVEFVEEEIDLWFLSILKKDWPSLSRKIEHSKAMKETLLSKLSGLEINEDHINQALRNSGLSEKGVVFWTEKDLYDFVVALRKASKPLIIAANKADLPSAEKNIKELQSLGYPMIPVSSEAELALRNAEKANLIEYSPGAGSFKILKQNMSEKQIKALEFIKSLLEKWGSTGVQQTLDRAVFEILEMIAVFPVADINKLTDTEDRVLPDIFLVKKGTTLKEFASKIHTEMAEQFVGGLIFGKKVGANYKLQHRDIVKILFKR